MSVNFGYGGYNMMGGMNANQIQNQNGGVYQNLASQNSCPMCYQHGPVPYNYQTFVNPLPKQAVRPSFLSRILNKYLGI